ncbi:MAG: hypothetical protein K5986_07405 [Clostridium sp.]|nr:hypothetical protein [Clostridium sp.]
MSELPVTLEEMQRDILQGDLSENPYLQQSIIPTLDKELKTKAKRIIPAINELLKLLNTLSEGVDGYVRDIHSEIDELRKDMKEIKSSIDNLKDLGAESNTRINDLDSKYNECLEKAAEIELDIKSMKNMYSMEEGKEDIMELKSKVKLQKGESKELDIKAEELYDPKKQIKIYAYDEQSKKYKYIDYEFTVNTSPRSVYEFEVWPLEIQIEGEGNKVTLVNKSNWNIICLIYK